MKNGVPFSANPSALAAAADVLGEQLQVHLDRLAQILDRHAASLDRRYLSRLRRMGFDARQRKALLAITPGAAARVLSRGRPAADFFEQVEYNGRRLAKLNLAPDQIVEALCEYDALLVPVFGPLPALERENLEWAREQLQFCVVLTLNNAFYHVREVETDAYQDLFRAELESRNLDELLPRMLEALSKFCRSDAGVLFLREPESGKWRLRAATEATVRIEPRSLSVTPGKALAGKLSHLVCESGKTGSVALDPSWATRYTSCWSVPLVFAGQTSGVMQFGYARHYEWLPREEDVLAATAERCQLAAEKALLVENLASRESQVRALAAMMVHAEERERRRISSELHDEAGQSLLCIRLQLEMLERLVPEELGEVRTGLAETRALTERTVTEIRRFISDLSPAVLEQLGLEAAIRQVALRLRRFSNMQVRLKLADLAGLPPRTAAVVYRLVQECSNNAARHSSARHVNISVVYADERVRLRVEDDGVGFRISEASKKRESFGLGAMRERVVLFGGEFRVRSEPGKGTTVSIELPVKPAEEVRDPRVN